LVSAVGAYYHWSQIRNVSGFLDAKSVDKILIHARGPRKAHTEMISQKPTPVGMSILLITPFLCVRFIEIYEVSSVRTIAECYLINIFEN